MNSFVPEIEQEVLGILLTGGPFASVHAIVQEEHFLHPAHKLIYQACETAHERVGSCKLNVVSAFIDKQQLEVDLSDDKVSSGEYLAHLCAGVVFGASRLAEAAKKVVEQWARHVLAEEFECLARSAGEPSCDVRVLASHAGERIDAVMSDVRMGAVVRSRANILEGTQAALKEARLARERGSGLTGIPWGLSDVNRLTGGIQRNDLTLLAARPSMGKTSVAMSVALKAAQGGFGCGVISLEMDAVKVYTRMISDFCYDRGLKVPYVDIIRGSASEANLNLLDSHIATMGRLPIVIDDQPGLGLSQIRAKLESQMRAFESRGQALSLLVVDHIGLISPPSRYSGNRNAELTEISSELKSMAREYGIAVVALSQLSRALEGRSDKRPVLSDLRDSGSLEQDADTVIFLYRDAYYLERDRRTKNDVEATARLADTQNKLEFIIAKQRNGPIRTVDLFCDMAFSAIRSAA